MPDLERAVVGAIPRADAAVVDHIIQAFAAMRSGFHGADVFAGRVFALHTGNRLLDGARLILRADVVAVQPQPVHFAAANHLLLADDGSIVFRLARHHARVASRASTQVDGHTPLVFALVGALRIYRME